MITSQTCKVYLSDIYTGYNVIDSVFGVMSIIGITYITRDNEGIHNCHSGQKKKCVFTVTCQKNLRSVGIIIIFFLIDKTGNSCTGIRFQYFIFEISGKMMNYAVFLPSFALNFDKKLAFE